MITLRQTAKLLFAVSQLPNLRNIHAEAPETLADIADNSGAVFDDESDIKRAIDLVFRLDSESSRRH